MLDSDDEVAVGNGSAEPTHAGRGRLRRGLRLAGLVFQLALCATLAVWAGSSGEVLYLVVAVVLGALALVLLLRALGRGPRLTFRRPS